MSDELPLWQDVEIIAIKIKGFIDKVETTNNITQYRVVYWWEGERRETWMYRRELQP